MNFVRRPAFMGLAVIISDRLTKLIVRGAMVYGESVKLTSFLRITYVENTGTAWGLFSFGSFSNYVFLAVNLAALFYLVANYARFSVDRTTSSAWSLIVSGAMGNLGDRIFVGAVVDFIDIKIFGYDFPVFNIADSALTAGGFILAFAILKNALARRRPAVGES